MSEAVTLTSGATGTIYGSLAQALVYLDTVLGDEYQAFLELDANDRKRAQLAARRYLDTLDWADDYDTFAERDALDLGTGDGDAAFPFRAASYMLAALAAADSSVLSVSAQTDQQQVTSVSIAGASLSLTAGARFGEPVSKLPADVLALVSPYLSAPVLDGGGRGVTGSDCNPFSTSKNGRRESW